MVFIWEGDGRTFQHSNVLCWEASGFDLDSLGLPSVCVCVCVSTFVRLAAFPRDNHFIPVASHAGPLCKRLE